MQGEIDAAAGAITTLQATTESLQKQIYSNDTDIATLGSSIVDLDADISGLQTQIDNLGDDDGSLQTQINELDAEKAAIATVLATETTLLEQIGHNDDLIEGLEGRIVALEASMKMKQNLVTEACDANEGIRAINDDGTVTCTTARPESTSPILQSYRTYVTHTVPANGDGHVYAYCAPGYLAMSAAYNAGGFIVKEVYAQSDYAYVSAHNYSSYTRNVYTFAMCLRVSL